ncbi:MAG: YibE/F family protein [Firmicutes bacterium]|jgi:uncharacterized membrane protein|nr:YibE/F family protein [Bacillota bacterium]
MKKTDSPDKRLRLYEILASVLIFAILIGWALALNLTAGDRELTAAQKRMFAVAEVTDVLADNASPDTWTEGRRIGQQLLEVKVLTGEHKGAVLEAANFLSAYANVDAKVGTKVIVRLDVDEQGELYVVSVPAYNRAPVMLGLALIFAALLVIIGRKKGVMALVGLVYTLACIWFIQVPMILRGAEPVLVSIIIVALTTAASLLFLTGLSRKTLCAVLGCVCGVGVAGIFAAVSGSISQLNGFNLPEAEDLVLRATQDTVRISGLLVSGILVASLGAVMDVAMSISSSCWELRQLNPGLPKAALFRSGMNIGRDAMGTMANTLILAFAGASLNTLLLFRIYGYPAIQLFNSDAIAVELIRGLAGSIGIILTVPLVAALSAALMPPAKGRPAKQR